jgi:NAD(P)-dependent dehydrogenase (short-subunit alcohol dehydrogenase family)
MEFSNKSVIVTGAASGMGLLSCKRFAERGANVMLVDINAEGLEAAAEQVREFGGKVLTAVTDIRDYSQIENAVKATVEGFGRIDILVNCAGGASCRINKIGGDFKDFPIWALDWGIDVNLKGPFYFTRAVVGQMAEQKSGVIIYLGSVVGAEGGGGLSADYSVAKSGIMYGLTKSMAQYGASRGIRACCVSPGPVLTREAMAKMKTLLGRAAEPIEVVDMITYLASDKAAFITGVNYLIDGGRYCMLP